MHIVYNSFFFAKHLNDIPFDNVLLAAYETGFFLGFPTTINKVGILNFIKKILKNIFESLNLTNLDITWRYR